MKSKSSAQSKPVDRYYAQEFIPGILESPRQAEVRRLLTKGLSNANIARTLNVAEGTIKHHLHNLYRAWGVKTRNELILKAFEPKASGDKV